MIFPSQITWNILPQLKIWCFVDSRSWIESHAEQWWSSVQALQAWASDELCRRLVRRLSSPHVLRRGSGVRAVVEVSRRPLHLTRFLLLVHTTHIPGQQDKLQQPRVRGISHFLDIRYYPPSKHAILTENDFILLILKCSFISVQIIIPMSLYVTIECSKLIQIYLIHQDLKMWDDTCDKGVECRALNIPEELGQVSFIKKT